ncbi:3-phosphoshikimate 1-carboxyvinyltransferase [bacterium]|nr:3-phosphoshikimate 1-carboxyvinyltransferase [bacterium]RQV95535.1 MAG: 3-phosphoshikimate 1-carboxyvinyltransferase [bacterium]
MDRTIHPINRLSGSITPPGDKSISHRALMMGAIGNGTTTIIHCSPGKDIKSTQNCLKQLGIIIESEGEKIHVHGRGMRGLFPPQQALDAGNSGTTMRLLSGILAAQPFESTITGDTSLSKRPMNRIVDPLRQMHAQIDPRNGSYAPLHIHGGQLSSITYRTPVPSAQIKSAILLAGLYANGTTSVIEPSLSRDHTERMLPCFGIEVNRDCLEVSVEGPAQLQSADISVPGDISSAAFFIIAASLIGHSNLLLKNVGINPTRKGILDVLENMGGQISYQNKRESNNEPIADLLIKSSKLYGVSIEGILIPKVIDEIPLIAIAATQAKGKTMVRDAKELRVKETDRITSVATNLKKMGVKIDVFDDGFALTGPQKLHGTVIDSYGDHRIAMSFAIAGLIAEGKTTIQNAECAEISYPGFFETLEKMIDD